MVDQLKPGTILDGRYRVDAVLGQGGFGITYAAENIRVGMRVAVKELFWQGHSVRSSEASPEVALIRTDDETVFEDQKRRFLQEARTIRDFSDQAGVVRILDYFETNGTAYIVMEFVDGMTLAKRYAEERMPCEELLRRFLPIIDTLDAIHKAGVIHRDISPENIMVQPDGSLKLIDFGAARQYLNEDGRYTTISRDSYSPGEQYDKNGRQGPWTDVYALCATLYACICGTPPQGAVQRMFLDELRAPSELGVDIKPAYEAILMKGLQLRPEKRWRNMEELARAIRDALPEEKPKANDRRGLLVGLLAGLLCAAVAIGAWAWHRYDVTHKFRGIETERIRFLAAEDASAAEFAEAQDELRGRLEAFAGRDNYILTVEGTSLWVTLPLDCFDDREITAVIREQLLEPVYGAIDNYFYEDKAIWEDPAQSIIAGVNQVLPSALEGPTMQYKYVCDVQREPLTKGQRANEIMDFKTRLDALGVPYAFGTAYGNDDKFVFRLGLDRACSLVQNTVGATYPLCIGNQFYDIKTIRSYDHLEIVEEDGGAYFRFTIDESDGNDRRTLEAFTRASLEIGYDRIYLLDRDRKPIACAVITEPVTDGVLEFRELCLDGYSALDESTRWLWDYFDVLIYQTSLPTYLTMVGWEYIDADGVVRLDDTWPELRFRYASYPDRAQALRERLRAIHEQYGYKITEGYSAFFIDLNLTPDETLPEQVRARLPELLELLQIDHKPVPKSLIFRFIEEEDEKWLRFVVSTSYVHKNSAFRTDFTSLYWGTDVKPLYDALVDLFADYDWDSVGLEPFSL